MSEPRHSPMTRKQLREFGLVTGAIFVLLFALLFPAIATLKGKPWHWVLWPWMILGILGPWALIHPASLVVVYRPWMKFSEALGWVNTRIILSILFFAVVMPVGVVMRLFGHDPLHKRFQRDIASYREDRKPRDAHHMERPF